MKALPLRPNDVKLIAEQFLHPASGVDFHWWHSPKTGPHAHEYYEIGVISKGTTKHLYNNQTTITTKGDVFIIKPGDCHVFEPVLQDSPFSQLNFSVTEEELRNICNVINPFLFQKLNEFAPYTIQIKDQYLRDILDISNQIYLQSDGKNEQKNTTLIKWGIFHLCVQFDMSLYEQDTHPEWFKLFLEKINSVENFTRPLSDLYQLAPYSQAMLNRYFKKYMGETLIGYIRNLKHRYACNLLIHSDHTTSYIANKISYTASHFNHEFQKREGMTPSEFRKLKQRDTKK